MNILYTVHNALWGPFTILFMLITGIYLSFLTGFVQFWGITRFLGQLKNKNKTRDNFSPMGALMTSLGSTLGVGSLTGVAAAIYYGGAGSVFWMLLAAFFGMATKYSEILLSVRFRIKQNGDYLGGPMVYLKNIVGSKFLSVIFSIFCILSTLGMGSMAQSNAIAVSANNILGVPFWLCGIVVALIVAPIIFGGAKSISRVSTLLVPFMSTFYVIGCLLLLFYYRDNIIPSFIRIFSEAFSKKAAGGGFLGFLLSTAVRQGFSKGIFSNEAGLGTAPIAHGCSTCQSSCGEGLLGAFEVFIDTFVVCLLTALSILVASTDNLNGLPAVMAAFSPVFGSFTSIFIGVCISFLAISSIVGCSFYGSACLKFLFKNKKLITVYRILQITCVILGAVLTIDTVFIVSDIANALMAFPNLLALWYLAIFVKKDTDLFRNLGHF